MLQTSNLAVYLFFPALSISGGHVTKGLLPWITQKCWFTVSLNKYYKAAAFAPLSLSALWLNQPWVCCAPQSWANHCRLSWWMTLSTQLLLVHSEDDKDKSTADEKNTRAHTKQSDNVHICIAITSADWIMEPGMKSSANSQVLCCCCCF